jgi:hypothetical protein
MGYHMTMSLGFLITLYYGLSYDNGFGLFSASNNIYIYIMGYYMTLGLGFFVTSYINVCIKILSN